MLSILQIGKVSKAGIYVSAQVDDKALTFLIDITSTVSITSADMYQTNFLSGYQLKSSVAMLFGFSQRKIKVQGCFTAAVKFQDSQTKILFYVVKRGAYILGLDAVSILQIGISSAKLRCLNTTYMAAEHPPDLAVDLGHLFDGTLGQAKGSVHKVRARRSGVQPISSKLRSLPLGVREEVATELQRLGWEDVIE